MRFITPVSQSIVRGFGNGHGGIDYLTNNGTSVKASGNGAVIFAGTDIVGGVYGAIAGKVIAIDHGDVVTEYAHLSEILVKKGQQVTQGQIIGKSGATGVVSGPHLHFGFIGKPIDWKNGYLGRVDPALYLNKEVQMDKPTDAQIDEFISLLHRVGYKTPASDSDFAAWRKDLKNNYISGGLGILTGISKDPIALLNKPPVSVGYTVLAEVNGKPTLLTPKS
jgi:hypothetical protein